VQPLFEFRVPPEYCPTRPSPPAEADEHLSWALGPYSTCWARRSTSRRLACSCYVPSSGFGYPRDGLLPPSPRRLCFAPAALLGLSLRSFLLAEGTRGFRRRMNPHAVSPVGIPAAVGGGPAQRAAASGL
jgi:hypothetical protein